MQVWNRNVLLSDAFIGEGGFSLCRVKRGDGAKQEQRGHDAADTSSQPSAIAPSPALGYAAWRLAVALRRFERLVSRE